MNRTCVLIVGGGTGGHISPGIALYEEFRNKGVRAYVLAGKKDARFSSLKDVAADDLLLYGALPLTGNIFKLPFFVLRFFGAVVAAIRILRRTGAAAVIGMGGYVSAPALIAARINGVPVFLCEQNTVPGKVTILFSKIAARIFTTFEVSAEYFKREVREKLLPAGNPIRKKVMTQMDRDSAKKLFNMKHCKRVILAIGGSQGALAINELMMGLITMFPDDFKDTGIIWSTGDYSYQRFKGAMQERSDIGSMYLSPFIDDVGPAYRASDIAISRAGSGVMVELAAMGVPSVLIPFPHAAMDHQERNADVFANAGASVKIANEKAVPEVVGPMLGELLNNQTQLQKMSDRALAIARPAAAATIVQSILDSVSGKTAE